MEDSKISMNLDSVDSGIARMKALLHAAEYILVGAESISGDDLEALKNLVDMTMECLNGTESKVKEFQPIQEYLE